VTPEEKAAERVGSVVAEKYRLRRVVGCGGMGAVFDAVHQFTGKVCAVKVLDPAASHIQGYAARFLREARAAAQIGHPCICDVFDAGQDPADGCLYLVLELLEGEDLGAAMRRGDLTMKEIVEIGAQVLEGLGAAHARGIVHRDVKPENVFLTRDERGNLLVKLLDFGVAKDMKRGAELHNTTQGMLVGTPYYMAPEQVSGAAVDGRADVWSTGAMLFHALSDGTPFEAATYNKLLLKIVTEPAPSLRVHRGDLPSWLIEVIDRSLRSDPKERWQSATQMAAWLRSEGNVEMGLDWEGYEDATLRTDSPFGSDTEVAPQVELGKLTPPARRKSAVDVTAPQRPAALSNAMESQPTLAAPALDTGPHRAQTVDLGPRSTTASGASAAKPTPQTWERPSRPGRRSSLSFVIGVVVGASVAIGATLGILAYFFMGPTDTRATGQPIEHTADAGADASPDADSYDSPSW
jgi:serine/threonine-protein kinase